MINLDVLYNTFIYFFTGYGVMAFSLAFVKTIFEPKKNYLKKIYLKKIYLDEDDEDDENFVTEKNEIIVESVKLGKRKKII